MVFKKIMGLAKLISILQILQSFFEHFSVLRVFAFFLKAFSESGSRILKFSGLQKKC